MRKFKCKSCGCEKLAYVKYAKCLMDVEFEENDNIHYGLPEVDIDDYLLINCGYVCKKCGQPLFHTGQWIDNEKDLIRYLSEDLKILAQEQSDFEEYLKACCQEEVGREPDVNTDDKDAA